MPNNLRYQNVPVHLVNYRTALNESLGCQMVCWLHFPRPWRMPVTCTEGLVTVSNDVRLQWTTAECARTVLYRPVGRLPYLWTTTALERIGMALKYCGGSGMNLIYCWPWMSGLHRLKWLQDVGFAPPSSICAQGQAFLSCQPIGSF